MISHFKKFAGVEKAFEFVLATTHLFWDPKQEDVKLLQTQRMLRRLKQFTNLLDVPVIFAGDFNSLPDSKVYDFISAGPEHNFSSAYSRYVDPFSTSSGPSEPSFTNVNGASDGPDGTQVPSFIGTLDYIFYQAPRYKLPILSLFDGQIVSQQHISLIRFSQSNAASSSYGDHDSRRSHKGHRVTKQFLAVGPFAIGVRIPDSTALIHRLPCTGSQ